MKWLEPSRIAERGLLRILVSGFALVVTLLGVAGLVAIRSTRVIESAAAEVGREQISMARILNDIQAGQHTIAAILHQISLGQTITNRDILVKELETANLALTKAASSAANTPESDRWRESERAVREFSTSVRSAIYRQAPLGPADLDLLFARHDRVMLLEQQLLDASEQRLEEAEGRIEKESRGLAANSRILLGGSLVLALMCAALTIQFARSSIRKIESQASELSRVSWHMLQDQESLARRFSHELHDELGQSLAAVKANLASGAKAAADWQDRRADCINLVDEAIANVRDLSQLLHPVILDDFGLNAGLRWLADGFAQRTGIRTDYNSTFPGRLPDETETHLFRISQEALTNVARHSGASLVTIELEKVDDFLRLSIEDNGRGLKQDSKPHRMSLGMTGMRARAGEIGGAFRLARGDRGGVRIEVDVPIRQAREKDESQENAHLAG